MTQGFFITTLTVLTVLYYFFDLPVLPSEQLFLTIATFLFAIFTGFFIARQGNRYSAIRDRIAQFDGELSSINRHFAHFGAPAQRAVQGIIKKHYQAILNHHAWDYHFTHKTTTLTDIHTLAQRVAGTKPLPSLKHLALQRILTGLEVCQISRKGMVALHRERIPLFQWTLVYFLGAILLMTISTIYSQGELVASVFKAASGSAVILVIALLHEFDQLHFFEGIVGKKSAQDILDIMSGRR